MSNPPQVSEPAVWGDPSHPNDADPGAVLPPAGYDYSAGMFTLADDEAAAVPIVNPTLIPRAVDTELRSYQAPHEATHRRYEPTFTVGIDQSAAGYTRLVPAQGLQYVKVLGGFIALTAAGTLMFTEGRGASADPGVGSFAGQPMGAIPIAANGGFVLPVADTANPWIFTSPDQALGLLTTVGAARGWLVCCYSNYDQ